MTYQEIKNLIRSLAGLLNVPFAYYQFEEETSPPFLVFNYPDSDDFFADNVNYQGKTNLDIYYCSDEKDFAAETAIEAFLKNNGIAYSKSQDYIDTDAMFQTLYQTEVFINEQS